MSRSYSSPSEARAAGAERYFTGKPCKHGNVAERRTSTRACLCEQCLSSHRAGTKTWKDANREHCREQNRQWHAKDRPRSRQLAKNWREANPDRCAENGRRYRERNPTRTRAVFRAWYQNNSERMARRAREWRKANPDRWRAIMRATTVKRHRAITATKLTPEESRQITAIYLLRRLLSRATGVEHHVDHHIPLSKGGLHHPRNLWVIPAEENWHKAASLPDNNAPPA